MSIRQTRSSKRWMMAAAAAAMCASAVAVSSGGNISAANPGDAPDTNRFSGANRYETAVAVSEDIDKCRVVVASGENFPDGLASAVWGQPILLTQADALPASTVAELDRIDTACGGVTKIRVAGGEAAISSDVFEDLADYGPTERFNGANRYETAIAIAEDVDVSGDTTVIMATGTSFPDSLAAGALAADGPGGDDYYPILLNNGSEVRSDVGEYLRDAFITDVIIVGGEAAVPASVKTDLEVNYGMDVLRLSGANRAATAVAIADFGWDLSETTPGSIDNATIVNGYAFPDALAAGPFASIERGKDGPILLTQADSLSGPTSDLLAEQCLTVADLYVIGGTAAVSANALAEAVTAATCTAASIVSATVANDNLKPAVLWVNGDDELTVTAKAGTIADGPNGTFVKYNFIQDGTPSNQKVVADLSDPDNPAIDMTADFIGLTYEGFVEIWNGPTSEVTAFYVAATTEPAKILGGLPAADGLVPWAVGTAGTADSTVVVTFDREINNPTLIGGVYTGVWESSNAAASKVAQLNGFDPVAVQSFDAVGMKTLTFKWVGIKSPVRVSPLSLNGLPGVGTGNEIRIAADKIETVVGLKSAELAEILTPAP